MQIAVLGCGVVGRGVVDLLVKNASLIAARVGEEVRVKYVLDRRKITDLPCDAEVVHDFDVIVSDPEITLVVEAMGGSHPAFEFSKAALLSGKHVVTSNKEVVANFGIELLATARESGVLYLFEASVGGGIPVLHPIAEDLAANSVDSIVGILNGTTNYILTEMFEGGKSFEEALAGARALGYAEANPAADVEGLDACRKIAILAAVATGKIVHTDKIHTEGITKIRPEDVAAAEKLGCAIKLLGRMVLTPVGDLFLMVAPFFVPRTSPLYVVSDVYNAVLVHGDFVDDVLFFGRGAGAEPTASALVGDVIHALAGGHRYFADWQAADSEMTDFSYFTCRRYLALAGVDHNAVSVLFGEAEFLPIDGGVAFLTPEISERELEDKLSRATATGGKLLSHIRLL